MAKLDRKYRQFDGAFITYKRSPNSYRAMQWQIISVTGNDKPPEPKSEES